MFTRTATAAPTTAPGPAGLARLGARLRALVRPERCGPIGLEIAAEKLHMVQFDAAAPRPLIRAAISLPYAGTREALLNDARRFRALVALALASRSFSGRQVVSCLAPSEVRIMTLTYQRGLTRAGNEKEVWSQRHQGFAAWEEQPHAG